MSKKTTDTPLKFEQAVEQLEAIIERIESGEVGLEDCLAQYERGMSLITHCRGVLSKAEAKIAELSPDAKGDLQVRDADVEIDGQRDEERA